MYRDVSAMHDAARVVLTTLALRDFRNLARLDLQIPDAGAVVIVEFENDGPAWLGTA